MIVQFTEHDGKEFAVLEIDANTRVLRPAEAWMSEYRGEYLAFKAAQKSPATQEELQETVYAEIEGVMDLDSEKARRAELERIGREHGVELDRRFHSKTLRKELIGHVADSKTDT